MDAVLRAAAMYLIVWLLLRAGGKRALSEATMFDFVLLLIVGEATQQALLGADFSVTNAFLVILTLVGIDIGTSILKQRFPRLERAMDGMPMLIVENGKPRKDLLYRARLDESDILEAARRSQGIERMDQIKFAILEQSGGISIIPYR